MPFIRRPVRVFSGVSTFPRVCYVLCVVLCCVVRNVLVSGFYFVCFLSYRTELRLDEGGDLTWNIPPTAEQEGFPFFLCETFEVFLN